MDELLFYYPEGHAAHFEQSHPERPERIEAIRDALEETGWWGMYPKIEPAALPESILESVHTSEYLARLPRVCAAGQHLDMDTYTTPSSWKLALNAAGGASAVARAVWRREARRGFALSRPPGHHAMPGRGMGFCLLNNIAIAAESLLQLEDASRLAIVDLDLHHGNGTQAAFYERGDVFYSSTHQSPHYPGTGELQETGSGSGAGTTANFPLLPFSGDRAFRTVMDELILPLLERYEPEMILVSYGFDTHWLDPLGNLRLSARVYGELIRSLADFADNNCNGRIALVLEGGYDLDAARACSIAVCAALLGEPFSDPLGFSPSAEGEAWRGMLGRAKEMWGV